MTSAHAELDKRNFKSRLNSDKADSILAASQTCSVPVLSSVEFSLSLCLLGFGMFLEARQGEGVLESRVKRCLFVCSPRSTGLLGELFVVGRRRRRRPPPLSAGGRIHDEPDSSSFNLINLRHRQQRKRCNAIAGDNASRVMEISLQQALSHKTTDNWCSI